MSTLREIEKIYEERSSKRFNVTKLKEWREFWLDAGPIRFAEEYLNCPPNVPPYPNWEQLQTEAFCVGCNKVHKKFRDDGVPIHIILSKEQKQLLVDVWKNGIRLIIVSAARGVGKTFILGLWDTWRLCTRDDYEISCMSGTAEQSRLIQKYVDYWRRKHEEVGIIIYKSPKAIGNRGCLTRSNGEIKFLACSPQAAMGPHVDEVQIDEACSAESKGVEGQEAIEAVDWQVTGRKDTFVWMTSTSHFLLGKFYEILSSPEKFGFKAYFWSSAKHISGKEPKAVYTDRNPNNWSSNVWWITNKDIRRLRRRKSNEEFLCMALGQPSLASGAIFRRTDLTFVFCNQCEECRPYEWGHCKLIQKYNLGAEDDPIKNIIDRKSGFDYGDPAPCALIIAGVKDKDIFVLYADEQKGLGQEELITWLDSELKNYKTYTFNPDPSIGGKHVSRILNEKGYSVTILEENAKEERVQNLKAIVEKHAIIIPKVFWTLSNSLKSVHRDKNGKVSKYNDHSFDACCYCCCDWVDIEGGHDILDIVTEWAGLKLPQRKQDDEFKGIIIW